MLAAITHRIPLDLIGRKERVCSRKRFAGFEMPNENTKKLQRLKERMRDKEAECALAQRSVAMLKAEMSGASYSKTKRPKLNMIHGLSVAKRARSTTTSAKNITNRDPALLVFRFS